MANSVKDNQIKIIPTIDKIGYGFGNLGAGISIQIIGAYLVFYSTAILGIPGSLIGIAIGLSVIWDALTDPLMGYLSDVTKSRFFGRRHIYLLIGGIGIALFNYILWHLDFSLPAYIKFIIISLLIILVKSFMTVYITPYAALGAELSSDYNERTTIQGIRTIFFLLGLAFVSVAGMYIFFSPTPEFPIGQLNPQSYRDIGLASSIFVLISSLVCFFSTRKYIPYINKGISDSDKQGLGNLITSFKKAVKNSTFRAVAFCYMFNNLSSALFSNIGLHVFTYTFNMSSQQIAIIIGAQFMVSILSQPIWSMVARKVDKKPAMLLGLLLSILGGIIFFILVLTKNWVSGNLLYFMPFSIVAGFGTGGLFTLPLSMVADTIDLDELDSGVRSEGVYYGCLTLFYKLSQSIAIFLIGFLLDIVKFDSSLPIQSESTVIVLGLILSIGSVISFGLGLISIKNYPLNYEKVCLIQKQIIAKHAR